MGVQLNEMEKCLPKTYKLSAKSREFGLNHCVKTSTHMGTTFNAKFYSFMYYRVEGIYFMNGVSGLQQEAQKLAFKRAVKDLGGIDNFADELGVSKYTIKNIIYDPTKDGNFKCAILAAIKGGADIDVVSPGTPKLNTILKQAISPSVKSVFLKDIIVNPNIPYLNYCHDENELILVDENLEVISSLPKLRELENEGAQKTAVKVLILDDLWHRRINIYNCGVPIYDVRKWEIGVKLVDKYGKGQGFRSDYRENIFKHCSKNNQLTDNSTEVATHKRRPETLEIACKLLGISKFTFYQLHKICLSDIYPLIKAIARNQITINRACRVVDVFFHENLTEREEMLNNLLIGEVNKELLEEIKEFARLQGSKAPRLQGSKAPKIMICEEMINEYAI